MEGEEEEDEEEEEEEEEEVRKKGSEYEWSREICHTK